MKFRQRGFTIIELIAVIIILFVLAVTAGAKLFDAGIEARLNKMDYVKGVMESTADLVRHKALVEGKAECNAFEVLDLDDSSQVTLQCGYPCPDSAGIPEAMETLEGFTWVGGNCAGFGGFILLQLDAANNPAECRLRYSAPSPANPPGISLLTTGC